MSFRTFIRESLSFLPDKQYIQLQYFSLFGKFPNLKCPKTFNEKLNWMKLYYRKDEMTTMVDKYAVKEYVSERIGTEYVIPTIGVWDNPEQIDLSILPSQFVLKCTHDSGSVFICKNKDEFDFDRVKQEIKKALTIRGGTYAREWPYYNVVPRIIAEPYMEDSETHDLRDYKFFCFDGTVKALFIATERQDASETKFDFFDSDFNHLDIRHGHPNAQILPKKPHSFDKMKELSEILSKGYPEMRVDFYEVNQKPLFGEITFFHHGGVVPFDPPEWDNTFGEWIMLPCDKA